MGFKEDFSFSIRKTESDKIKKKYPDRYPVIIELQPGQENILNLDKRKFLVPNNLTVGQLLHVVKSRIKNFNSTSALFLFVNNTLPQPSHQVSEIYNQHAEDCGFLYFTVAAENTFG